MARSLSVSFGVVLLAFTVPALAQPPTPASQPPAPEAPLPILTDIAFEGVTVFRPAELIDELRLTKGERLPAQPSAIADALQRFYRQQEYSYATATASFDGAAGVLTLTVDEGRIDDIEFDGVEASLARRFLERFDVRPGDIFNAREVRRAIDRVLAPTHGGIVRSTSVAPRARFRGARDVDRMPREAVQLVAENGRRVLRIHLEPRVGRFDLNWGTDGREDWFSPVDGFAPGLGFMGTVFDSGGFNHTVVNGFVSYKFTRERVGYSVGFERPVFRGPRLFLGAEIHDLTASDDVWRLSRDEESLVALGFKNNFRDYYDRHGVQAHAALRLTPQHEVLVAFRHDRHAALENLTDYSFFRDDAEYRRNAPIQPGLMRGLVLGYTFESRTFDRASLGRTYRRHQVDDLYGSFGGSAAGYRVEWTSEIASPDTFGGDFDFTRHILNARAYTRPTLHQYVDARLLAGWGSGTLPPQRIFALGGIGSVRGYTFKEQRGERMTLVNLEYKAALGDSFVKGVAFFDAGRVTRPLPGYTTDWLRGVGLGLELGSTRVDFGWRLDDIPKSLQVLVRFNPLF